MLSVLFEFVLFFFMTTQNVCSRTANGKEIASEECLQNILALDSVQLNVMAHFASPSLSSLA